ncbi:MAG: amino-acid N-acetyltransferase [Treponema sp.]|jgi:amino-acid N-acetyltransferase|nr:amino-acid N-acetyltransferase [Treponema sp.]
MNKTAWSQMDLIREAFHYQSRFDGSTMVFKIDFPVTEDPGFPYLMKDLALLARTGFRVVIVPGAKEWIDAVLSEYGIVSDYAGTTRITTTQAIPLVEMAAFHVATRFMTGLSASRVDAVIGNFVRARGLGVIEGRDMEHTGAVDKVLIRAIQRVLQEGMVSILPCIGYSPTGKAYNVPSDEIALAASTELGAVKLFIVSVNGGLRHGVYTLPETIPVRENCIIGRLAPQEAEAILQLNQASTEDKPLQHLRLALQACRAGIERVHLINGGEEGVVLRELFSNLGSGTMVHADEYEAIRSLKSADIADILRLMEPLVQQGFLVRRTGENINEKKADYVVFEIDGSVHACGALHDWGEGQGEIAAIATDPSYADKGLGRRIVRYLIDRAERQGLYRVFLLTTHTHDWFELLGFTEASVESLPTRRRNNYDYHRNSTIFALELQNRMDNLA